MRSSILFIDAGTALLALLLTGVMYRVSTSVGMIDQPNARSSHTTPTPRGGGLAIVIASLVAISILFALQAISGAVFIALAGGGLPVATVGFMDDRKSLSPRIRLAVHLGAAAWAVGWIGPFELVRFTGASPLTAGVDFLVCAVGIAWFLNVFNFMDGIDGLAASEGIFICWAQAGVAAWLSGGGATVLEMVVGAACFGFLAWNCPPARIFMGDVGSGYLGFVIATTGLLDSRLAQPGIWTWIILAGVFVVDSTLTLIRRGLRGESLALAHRMHAYQRAAARWGHRNVTVAVCLLNLLWLLPCAAASAEWPSFGPWIAAAALCPLAIAAFMLGAGRREAAAIT